MKMWIFSFLKIVHETIKYVYLACMVLFFMLVVMCGIIENRMPVENNIEYMLFIPNKVSRVKALKATDMVGDMLQNGSNRMMLQYRTENRRVYALGKTGIPVIDVVCCYKSHVMSVKIRSCYTGYEETVEALLNDRRKCYAFEKALREAGIKYDKSISSYSMSILLTFANHKSFWLLIVAVLSAIFNFFLGKFIFDFS